jgi:hypothetical protein
MNFITLLVSFPRKLVQPVKVVIPDLIGNPVLIGFITERSEVIQKFLLIAALLFLFLLI